MEQPFFDSKKIIPTLSSLLIVKKYFQSIFAFSPSCPSNVATGPQVVFHFLYSGVWIMGSIVSFHICLLLIILFPICLFLWHAVFERVTKNAVCGLWAWRSKLNLVGGHINVCFSYVYYTMSFNVMSWVIRLVICIICEVQWNDMASD